IIGKTFAEIGVSGDVVVGRPIDELLALARAHESVEMVTSGRTRESRFDAIYAPDGTISAVGVLVRDVHNRRLAQTRLDLLTKLSGLVGLSDYDDVAEMLARIPIPELADWCVVNLVEDGHIERTFIAHHDPSKAFLRDALLRAMPAWDGHPLWQEMLTGGFQ